MGFKMKGFNPGKGTSMGNSAFKRERQNPLYVENSDGSRFYPPKPEEKKFENYGDNLSVSPRSYTVTTDGTPTTRKRANTDERHNEATYVIRNEDAGYDEYTQGFHTKESQRNEILYNNLESEIKDYNKDPLSVPINSHDFYSDNKNYISGLNDYYDEKKVDLAKEFKSNFLIYPTDQDMGFMPFLRISKSDLNFHSRISSSVFSLTVEPSFKNPSALSQVLGCCANSLSFKAL